jgi:hypothetical protein
MSVAYLDCFSGISGNMVLGALLDAGLELDDLREGLAHLGLSGYVIRADAVKRRGLSGTHVTVEIEDHGPERHLHDIEAIISGTDLPERIQRRSLAVFRCLAEAEAKVHGMPVDHVHFHEVGAVDAIVDVVGTVVGFDLLGVEHTYASSVRVGRGTVTCAHGVMPVPAPATAELLKGVPTYGRDVDAELVTPTGAAILTTFVRDFGAAPPMVVTRIGYGAGTRELPHPNLLRLSIGENGLDAAGYEQDRVTVIETNIDDMNPEFYEHITDCLFDAGAVDVFLTPIHMKHSRPGVQLSVLVAEDRVSEVVDVLFNETTTIGVRFGTARRWKLGREQILVRTPYGAVSVKVASSGETVMNVAPELRDCRRLARERGVPLKEVYKAAQEAARARALTRSA